jgi:Lipid A 3-O-deacylase (PagL)
MSRKDSGIHELDSLASRKRPLISRSPWQFANGRKKSERTSIRSYALTSVPFARALKAVAISFLLFLAVHRGEAQDFSAGVRGGFSFENDSHRFTQIEAFGADNLPWHWNFYSNFILTPRVEASAGWLSGENTGAFVGTLGPSAELSKGKFPLTMIGGASPTVLSRYHFGGVDFGDRFQFTDYIGLNWRITEHVSTNCRFQHMSNAGISSHNPGLNILMFSASYGF